MEKASLQEIIAHSKAYGFIGNSSEIYGGVQAVYDYLPYGVLLKRKIQEFWWKTMTSLHDNIVGLDASIIMSPSTWEASGHVAGFHDWMVDHKTSQKRYRVDVLIEEHAHNLQQKGKQEEAVALLAHMNTLLEARDGEGLTQLLVTHHIVCPVAKTAIWTTAKEFNLMLATHLGSVKDDSQKIYLRPETAQGIFVNFLNVQKTTRLQIPFGIAQIGKAFRNEIVARQFIFRMREFEQMEMQFFVEPDKASYWFDHWLHIRKAWYEVLGIKDVRTKPHEQLAHYADAAVDIEYLFPFGFKEVEGIHNRTHFDLTNHSNLSKKTLQYFDAKNNRHYIPYVIETSVGCDRLVLMLLCHAFTKEERNGNIRTYLRFPAPLAPIQVAVLPLLSKEPLKEKTKHILDMLRYHFSLSYDDKGSIGKRYTRQDLLGTPYCITVDFQTLEDDSVTIRHRDTMEQIRLPIASVQDFLTKHVDISVLLKQVPTQVSAT